MQQNTVMTTASQSGPVSAFMRQQFRHFNAATLVDAAHAYSQFVANGGRMVVALAGAMSTAELGVSLAEMIRRGKVHAISCTGANLEEDVFNLVAHEHYRRVPHYRELSAKDETALLEQGLNRVTDTCIPEDEAIRRIEHLLLEKWQHAEATNARRFPHEYFYELVLDPRLQSSFQIDPRDSWVHAAARASLPLYVPGWEDSTLGSIFAARVLEGRLSNVQIVRPGVDYTLHLARWYHEQCRAGSIGLFQIGGGIAGDFPIGVVPMMRQDLGYDIPLWGYFCQISDSTTSYGSYSGAVPNEKITWGKVGADTPRFVIESDATIVCPLLFAYVLGW